MRDVVFFDKIARLFIVPQGTIKKMPYSPSAKRESPKAMP